MLVDETADVSVKAGVTARDWVVVRPSDLDHLEVVGVQVDRMSGCSVHLVICRHNEQEMTRLVYAIWCRKT